MTSRAYNIIFATWLLLAGTVIGVGLGYFPQKAKKGIHESLFGYKAGLLWCAYKLWVEAGRPSGTNLTAFAEKRQWDYVLAEKDIEINGVKYRTIFMDPNLESHRTGVLYVTTNGTVIWEGEREIVSEKELP